MSACQMRRYDGTANKGDQRRNLAPRERPAVAEQAVDGVSGGLRLTRSERGYLVSPAAEACCRPQLTAGART